LKFQFQEVKNQEKNQSKKNNNPNGNTLCGVYDTVSHDIVFEEAVASVEIISISITITITTIITPILRQTRPPQ